MGINSQVQIGACWQNDVYLCDAFYELLMQWHTTGKREVEIDWLKKQFQLDDGYDRMDNFKARVLDPAVEDINTLQTCRFPGHNARPDAG
jgi:plasmid replication initiation protein